MKKLIVWSLVMFGAGFLACYTLLVNRDWYRGKGLGDAKLALTDCDKVIAEIERYDWDTKAATAVMKAESKCDVNAKGDTDLTFEENGRVYGYSVGAFQIRILPGREDCDSFELETTVACAYNIDIEAGRDFTDWSMLLNGKYRDSLE